jgi:hypothetical protein
MPISRISGHFRLLGETCIEPVNHNTKLKAEDQEDFKNPGNASVLGSTLIVILEESFFNRAPCLTTKRMLAT